MGSDTITAYCDMDHEGGGWTRVGRGIGGDYSSWITATGDLNINADGTPADASTYKLSDAKINAIPKGSFRFKSINRLFKADHYWSAEGVTYAHSTAEDGNAMYATAVDPEGLTGRCLGSSHGSHGDLSGLSPSGQANAGALHVQHISNGWYIRQEIHNCNHGGTDGTTYCMGTASGCDVELYVR